jgi:RNA polymerase sigma-70 factor, ECF subfamily
MEELTDLQLIEEVRNGKRRAFTALMHRYQQRVYWAARRIVGTHEDADDIAQETFVKAYTALGDFRGDSSFFTWIYRIAVNLSLNAVRKRQLVNYLRENEIINRVFPSSEDPSRDVEFKETQSRLQEAISRLPERQRAVFVMRYFDEMSYEEISEVMKTSVGGLKANYFHAIRKVREYMTNEIPSGTSGHTRK